ncbi:MAG: anti-sigma factor family protein [Acidimicrobiales bacterium]
MWRRREIACRQAVELITDYLDGALSPRDRARFEAHLADCPYCVEYLNQLRATIAALGRLEAPPPADEVYDDLVALYRRWQRR